MLTGLRKLFVFRNVGTTRNSQFPDLAPTLTSFWIDRSTVQNVVLIELVAKRFDFRMRIFVKLLDTVTFEQSDTQMLTLKYQSTQRGPQYLFSVESSANFLSKDLALIAYSSSEKEIPYNFTHISAQALSSLRYVHGNVCSTASKPGFTMLTANFNDAEARLIRDQDITITLLKNSLDGHSGYWAVAHFQVRVNHCDVAICFPDGKGAIVDVKECKFDTLTFEQLGSIVRLPGKRSGKRNYENVEEDGQELIEVKNINELTPQAHQIKDWSELSIAHDYKSFKDPVRLDRHFLGAFDVSSTLESCFEEEFQFPQDVFETDVVFVDLPTKK